MAKGKKYIKLTEYLKENKSNIIKISFDELESIMQEKIPASIYKYKTFGSNFDHSFSYGWSLAGYSAKANFESNIVVFIRDGFKNSKEKKIKEQVYTKSSVTSNQIKVLDFYKKIQLDKNDRYRSWEHCYSFFTENRKKDIAISDFSLNLFAYLASWGMLRGSSFLLQKDYLFHNDVVEEILKEKYDILVGINPIDLNHREKLLMFELVKSINKIYYEKTYYIKGIPNSNTYPSDILLTKILLGTLGCIPAYDRYFIEGLKETGIFRRKFSPQSINKLKEFYLDNKYVFDKSQHEINKHCNVKYPIMKLIDMHFWQIGYEKDILSKNV